ncbi:MAG: hypothetical protein CFH21_00865 [Alphaproteobacteria bacterium MarineAlpha5_Bin11]|nr:MAG: hypothetical protein CFH21_00865 [Alphaproteobacteria bacterium MarineAlpha5_Bin11]PPR51438.1 MAG: hypothetical protein CFH20_00631 [Alphaproteobacteria bacterium MarineAlpha5_Bin10]|tara:strand:- start:107 stop:991 length:885 start_codon:yes stop_codon:yes gene_type:complete
MSEIQKKLEKYIKTSDPQKSSHWADNLKDANFKDIEKSFGFGETMKKRVLISPIIFILQRLTYGWSIFVSKKYPLFKKFCDLQNKFIDNDVIRHIFTFNLLSKHNLLKGNICVIGDGKANFVGGLLLENKKVKIFSINLTEVLIHDYLILKKANLIKDKEICVVTNKKDLYEKNKKLFLIDASNLQKLENIKIDLFVNIASMQEMKTETIESYFKVIKKQNSYFYCCNRERKKLVGGEELIFENYPWGNSKIIFYEDCPWHKKFYSFNSLRDIFNPPYIVEYNGNVKHKLVKYL